MDEIGDLFQNLPLSRVCVIYTTAVLSREPFKCVYGSTMLRSINNTAGEWSTALLLPDSRAQGEPEKYQDISEVPGF